MNDDIWDDKNKAPTGTWFKFKEIGDKICGKYVSCRREEDSFNPGKFKLIATIENESGLVKVSLKDNAYFEFNISKMKKGDDVGFKFTGLVDGKPGMQKAKSIEVFHKASTVFVTPTITYDDVINPEDIPF